MSWKQEEEADGGPIERQPSRETVEAQLLAETVPTILLGERKVGPWRRTFTLPDDVEMRELKARLEAGLLRIDLPKRSIETENDVKHGGIRIEIE
jgi:HSP20 family molecular chaperone IbpA